ncbi:site-specific integrase [Amycolatopsis sp. NPDC006131]|uniref:site-specific integrase n=1 Tax=Amycolatopsis sp. NPDC006131 TaxID=3156731 RepID=UPI0033A89B08
MPTSSATLADYLAHLADAGRAPATLKHAMAVIRKQHRLNGHGNAYPDNEAALLVLQGHRKEWAQGGNRTKEAPPITLPLLRRLSAACDPTTLAGKRDRLVLVMGMWLAGRRSELAALRIEDTHIDEDGELVVYIRESKTDQQAEGETVYLPPGDHTDTDPVSLYREWIAALEHVGADTSSGYLFRAITRHGKLYQHQRISDKTVNNIVQRAARAARLPNADRYSAHSLRAGFITQGAMDGVPLPLLARAGRWDPTSPTPMKYVRMVDQKQNNPRRRMSS